MDINNVIKRPEYEFLQTEKRLGKNIMLMTYGGSHAYGLNGPNSDIDIRGIILPTKRDLLGPSFFIDDEDRDNKNLIYGNNGFEQYLDKTTDTTLYSLDKILGLLYKCNPNTIEILGCKPEHYAIVSKAGQLLLDNAEIFLSKNAYNTFAGYARGQFQRLKNALNKDRSNNFVQQINLIDRINRMQTHLEQAFPTYKREMIEFYISDLDGNELTWKGEKIKLDAVSAFCYDFDDRWMLYGPNEKIIDTSNVKVSINVKMDGIDFNDFKGIYNEISSVVKDFNSHLGHRNNKKDDYHLNKHAMHLVRLYLMCFDILQKHKIITFRENDIDFLMSIKNGYYMKPDGTYKAEFFDMIDKLDEKLFKLYEESKLPVMPNKELVTSLMIQIMETKFELL